MKCPNCGIENANSAKYCKKCGEKLHTEEVSAPVKGDGTDRKLIIAAVAAILIVLAGAGIYASGILDADVPLETKDFDAFEIDVPVGSDFVAADRYTGDADNIVVEYDNNGKYSDEAYCFFVGNGVKSDMILPDAELKEDTGNIKIYEAKNGSTVYEAFAQYGESKVLLIGDDSDTLKRMAESYSEDDLSKLASEVSEPAKASSSSSSSRGTSGMSILGGSFETGDDLEDKTYASIYVGPEYSGESVTIQIYYSRDGSVLNNGNMVPITVDSSGYINVRSADAYRYFPDYAEINLYDSAGKLLDTHSVSLSPSSGTQTF